MAIVQKKESHVGAWVAVIVALIFVFVVYFVVKQKNEIMPPLSVEPPKINLSDPLVIIQTLSGTVTSIDIDSISMIVPSILGVEVPPQSPLITRKINIDENTHFAVAQEKSDALYQKQLEEYQAKRDQGERALPPARFDDVVITIRDIKVGDMIRVTSAGGEDIKSKEEFYASSIIKL